jgi:hypothetical protein
MQELDALPPEVERTLGGEAFRRRWRLVLPFLTVDPEGYPRAALLTAGELRALSSSAITVAVAAGSRTALNLIRRRQAMVLCMQRDLAASIRVRAGRGRTSRQDPDRTLFPLSVFRVKLDQPGPDEGRVGLLTGPVFAGEDSGGLFSEELFAEMAEVSR